NFEDVVGGLTHQEQLWRSFQNLVHGTGNELEQLGDSGKSLQRFFVSHTGNAHGHVAFEHPVEYSAEQAGVAAEHVSSLNRVLITRKNLVHRAENTFCQQ